MLQGCLWALAGNRSAGIDMIKDGIVAAQPKGSNLLRMPWYLSCMAKAHAELGELDKAWRGVDDAIAAMQTTKETWPKADIYQFAGDLALKSSMPDAMKAQSYFEQALAVARRQKAKTWELQVAMRLARLWLAKGDRGRAVELLAPVYGWFSEGFDTPDLKAANALLLELTPAA
jgi:predicted ATPase